MSAFERALKQHLVSYRIVAAGRGTAVSTARPHGTHHISATDGARFLVCMPLHLLDTPANCAETDKPIEMSFRIQANVDPVNHVLVGGAHRRHLTNTTE